MKLLKSLPPEGAMKCLCLTVLCLVLIASPVLGARLDTSFSFTTIETAHFSIHYHQGLEETGRRIAAMAEEVHGKLAAEFRLDPRGKTQVVLIDDSDFANGSTSVIPYDTIYLQIVPPSFDSTIGSYDDWLRTLFVHEYAHVLTMDPERGYSHVMRRIFGKPLPAGDPLSLLMFMVASPPNIFLPRWWHEGMATWAETEYTRAGRGRSTMYEMILRAAVRDNNLPSIDTVNGDVPYWPDGHFPYIFGLRLQKYIADTRGKETLGDLSLAHAGRLPYLIGAPPEEYCDDKSYRELHDAMLADLRREEGERITTLEKLPPTPFRVLREDGEILTAPRFSPDGSLIAYNRHDPNGHTEIIVTDRNGKEVKARVRRLPSDDGISWAPDGSHLYFSQAEINRGFDVYEDLYVYDIRSDRLERLTHGLRVREPELSPDRSTLALVVSNRGSQNLALLDAAGVLAGNGKPELHMASNYVMMRVATPRWSPDGSRIAYALTDEHGKSAIYLYEPATGHHLSLIAGNFNAAYPVWSKDGRTLFFVSDETGVFNLFAFPLDEGKSYQVSHLLGGALQPDISPDGTTLIYSSYSSRGFKIAAMAAGRGGWLAGRSPVITPYWRESADAVQSVEPEKPADPASSAGGRPYSPWGTLFPRFWLPTLTSDGNGVIGGLFTMGQDVLGYHSYLAEASYGTKFEKFYYALTYRNDTFYPSILLKTYNQEVLYSDLLQRGDYYEENRGGSAEVSVPLNFLESQYRVFAGYQFQRQKALSPLVNGRFNGISQPVFQGERNNFFVGLEFGNTLKYPYSISREEGRLISFKYRRYNRDTGSDINSEEYTAGYDEFLGLPRNWLPHHVIHYNLAGGVATGERTVQQAFQIGGVPSLLNRFPLRGYPSRFETGKCVVTGTLEYRAPIRNFFRGIGTLPFFMEKLHGAVFADAGEVWDDGRSFRLNRLKVGAGAEVRADITLGYWLKVTPALGYAHGFNSGGEDQVYFTIYADL
jgi:Tol biopolymer transport system component